MQTGDTQTLQRRGEYREDIIGHGEAAHKTNGDGEKRLDQAGAQLRQMGGKGHRVIGDLPLALPRVQIFFSVDGSEDEAGALSISVSLR